MITRTALAGHLDELLEVSRFDDYCPNGLQVEGREEIRTLVTGVTACAALLHEAVQADADAVLVHHGYFWRGESPAITGMKAERLRLLLRADLNLYAYHLPLDAHPELGNNVQLARRLDLVPTGPLVPGRPEYGCRARPVRALPAADFARALENCLGRPVLHVEGGGPEIAEVGLCTGAGQGGIEDAAQLGLDAFVSGEISEQTTHVAREGGVHFYACGHHATERFGVQALGAALEKEFDLEHRFIDIDNPA